MKRNMNSFMPFSNTTDESKDFKPPTRILSDYLEICFLAIMLPLGTIFNFIVLRKLFKSYRHRTTVLHQVMNMIPDKHDVKAAFELLKVHLTVANLLVLLLYCPMKIGWLTTYHWIAGEALCKICQFMGSFSFHISSNIVTCIAFDRLRIVSRICSKSSRVNILSSTNSIRQVKQLLIGAWTLAFLCSIPQVMVWTTLHVLPNWAQCTTVWMVERATKLLPGDYFVSYKTYQAFHLILVFWLPFVVILLSYSFIMYKLSMYACLPFERMTNDEPMVVIEIDHQNESDLSAPQSTRVSCYEHAKLAKDKKKSTIMKENRSDLPHHPRSNAYRYSDASFIVRKAKVSRGSEHLRRYKSEVLLNKSTLLKQRPLPPSIPAWRIQMRSKMFKTTAAVVTCYTLCWLPYNILGWLVLYDVSVTKRISDQLNWLNNMILINSVLNPFLYGFSRD